MDLLVWLLAVNLLLIAAFFSFVMPRAHFATPWLGLATVVVGSWQAFSSSATLVAEGSIGAGLGWLVTTVYGLIGLGIVIGYIRLQPVPYVSLGTIVAGIIYVASFYAYLPPYSSSLSGMLVFGRARPCVRGLWSGLVVSPRPRTLHEIPELGFATGSGNGHRRWFWSYRIPGLPKRTKRSAVVGCQAT